MDKVEELYQGIHGMKHDINNHILGLEEHTEVQDADMETSENILPIGVEINLTEPVGNNVDVKL